MKKSLSITIDERLLQKIKDIADRECQSVSAVIQEAVKAYVKNDVSDSDGTR